MTFSHPGIRLACRASLRSEHGAVCLVLAVEGMAVLA